MEAAEASSPSADGETLLSAFLFDNFFFAPVVSKKKWLTDVRNLTGCVAFVSLMKVFVHLFSKGGAVEAAEASSPSADGEIPLSALACYP